MCEFQFHPRWPEIEASASALVQRVHDAGLGMELTKLIEMLERRDVELEDYLKMVGCGGAIPGVTGIKRGDLYDDFTTGVGTPPPNAETGQVWTSTGAGAFEAVYGLGVYQASGAADSFLTANSLKADARLRARIIPSSTFTMTGLVFRYATAGDHLMLRFHTRQGGGSIVNLTELIKEAAGFTTVLQTAASFTIVPELPIDIDLTYNGTQITATANGAPIINYNTATGYETNVRVGWHREATTFGAWEDGNNTTAPSHMSYIWCTDPV